MLGFPWQGVQSFNEYALASISFPIHNSQYLIQKFQATPLNAVCLLGSWHMVCKFRLPPPPQNFQRLFISRH